MSNTMSISYIIPTKGRDTLGRTLTSIERWNDDEIIVEVDNPPSGRWGNDQRNSGMKRAKGDFLAFIDDDDYYTEGHREIMEKAMKENPDKPHLFRIMYPNGRVLWGKKEVEPGNMSTQMILVPNKPGMLHHWQDGRNMADYIFIANWKWEGIVWHEDIICNMGHDDEESITYRSISNTLY